MSLSSSSSSSSNSFELIMETINVSIEASRLQYELLQSEEAESSRPSKSRKYIHRDRSAAHDRLISDYFAENAIFQGYFFRRRFRMQKSLFLSIVDDLTRESRYFQQKPDARGTAGFSPIQKCTVALRQLAYGTPPDGLDESFRMSARVARESLDEFCEYILKLYGPKYLRRPTYNDTQQLYAHHASVHGFPGMVGSLDCLHWAWGNCPNAYKGQYTRGDHGYPTVILEAVASQDLWIWHAFFGAPGASNDINVLNMSPLFNTIYEGTSPECPFQLRGSTYKYGYYLVDGIYPTYATFVKSYTCPLEEKRIKFKRAQERARKDVERAFGVLKKRWQVLKKGAPYWDVGKMRQIMYTCIVLHNMIIEDEGNAICQYDENETTPTTVATEIGSVEYNSRRSEIRNVEVHHTLRADLVEHIYGLQHIDLNVDPVDDFENEYSDEDFA